jgi:hypothetical protein
METKKQEQEVATIEMCIYCFDALICHFEQTKLSSPTFGNDK